MKIIRLESENVKRLKAVEITPEGNMVVIGGENAAGKTSVLDSIMYAIGGKSCVPGEPIRRGEESAIITVELDDLIITRSFTATGSYLKVANQDGASFKSPQTMLDKLVGKLSFDPLEFLRFKPQEQHEMLRSLVGVDFTELDRERQSIYDARRDLNRDVEKMRGTLALIDYPKDTPDEPVNVDELMVDLKQGREHNEVNQKNRFQLTEITKQWQLNHEQSAAIHAKIVELQNQQSTLLLAKAELEKQGNEIKAIIEGREDIDVTPIEEKIRTSNEINIAIQKKDKKKLYQQELKELVKSSEIMTKKLKDIDEKI